MPLDAVLNVDCIEGMAALPPKSIDVIVTSPPYNIGKEYKAYNDNRPRREFLTWLGSVFAECNRVLADDGSFFLNVGGKPSDPWIPLDIANEAREHFHLQNVIHWVKSIAIPCESVGRACGIDQDLAVGHYKPVNSERYLSSCQEYVFHLTRKGTTPIDKLAVGVEYQDKSNIRRWASGAGGMRDRGNTWFIPYDTIQSSRPHPTVFPDKLPEMCIQLHGVDETTVVMDPFMGTGSTAVASVRLGVRFLGFEIDPDYVEIAEERIAEAMDRRQRDGSR
ncbi:MAG: site-specific DNA-methyltransferase [Thermoplasmata archaeon]|nr:MAG: site-specific DNA-methyltransferase [Thermoplasmata archaeon]